MLHYIFKRIKQNYHCDEILSYFCFCLFPSFFSRAMLHYILRHFMLNYRCDEILSFFSLIFKHIMQNYHCDEILSYFCFCLFLFFFASFFLSSVTLHIKAHYAKLPL